MLPTFDDPLAALRNSPFWLDQGLYGGAFLLYAAALARLPLNIAYLVLTSGAVSTVALLSILIFTETLHFNAFADIVLVIASVALITVRVA